MKSPKNKAAVPERQKLTNSQKVIEGLLLLFVFFNLYVFAALITFDPADPGWSQTAWHEPIQNIGGVFGAYVGDILLQAFGFVAYLLPFLGVAICAKLAYYFYGKVARPNYFTISLQLLGVVASLFSLCCIFEINVNDWLHYQSGGVLGSLLALVMVPIFNVVGTTLICLALFAISVTLLSGLSWLSLSEYVGMAVIWVASPLVSWVTNRRQRQRDNSGFIQEDNNEFDDITPPMPVKEKRVKPSISAPIMPLADDVPVMTLPNENTHNDYRQIDDTPYAIDTNFPPSYVHMLDESAPPVVSPANVEDEHDPLFHGIRIRVPSQPPEMPKAPEQPTAEAVNALETEYDHFYYDDIQVADLDKSQRVAGEAPEIALQAEKYVWDDEEIRAESAVFDDASLRETDWDAVTDDELSHVVNDDVAPTPAPDVRVVTPTEQSLIHPLLMRHDLPLTKPTTPLPSLDLLTSPPLTKEPVDMMALKQTAELVEKSLADFRVSAKVVGILPGPVITLYELDLAPGVKASRISALSRDLARSLSATAVRVVEVMPGKPYVGLELPNAKRQTVYLREVLDSQQFREAKSPLSVVLGKDISGESVVADLAKMPHLLVAGTTGSGKSVGVNAMIISILYKSTPDDVRFIMIDPKMLELSVYEGIPHLLTQVVTDMKDAANALNWCVNEMERRYRLMSVLGVRNVVGYNDKIKQAEEMGRPIPDPLWKPGDTMDTAHPTLEKLPFIVVMVDEFADLIMAVGKKIEELIARLAQKARAAGIHLVLATQRPSVDVITGLIKANIPTRIAFTVSSKIDSRTILDQMGAESLLGMGDMLYLAPNSSIPVRVHGAFVRDEEVHAVAQDWKARGVPKYIDNITASVDDSDGGGLLEEEDLDPLFDQVVVFVTEKRRGSISSVQRQFRIGYNRAARIVEQMESAGIVSAPNHSGNREVLAPPPYNDF